MINWYVSVSNLRILYKCLKPKLQSAYEIVFTYFDVASVVVVGTCPGEVDCCS